MNSDSRDTKTRLEHLRTLRILSVSKVGKSAAFMIPTLYTLSTYGKSYFQFNLIYTILFNAYFQPVFWYGSRLHDKIEAGEKVLNYEELLKVQNFWFWVGVLPGSLFWSCLTIFNFPSNETVVFLYLFLLGSLSAISISYSISKKMVWSYALILSTTMGIMSYIKVTPFLSVGIVVYLISILKLSKETGAFIDENLKLTLEKESLVDQLKEQTEILTQSQEITRNAGKASAISQITNSLSHEINNPLQIIKMNVERAFLKLKTSDKPVDVEKLNSILQIINRNTDRITSKVNSLQSISEGGEELVQSVEVNMSELIESEIKVITSTKKNESVKIETKLDENILVNGHEESIRQIFISLFQNAFDVSVATDNKIVQIFVNQTEGFPILEVIDSGAGVPKELREKVFEPFFSSKSKRESLGLGLSTARSLAENMGARLYVSSQSPSTFRLEFPKS